MAKSKSKVDISSNFENLKAQMMKKKEMAETLASNTSDKEEKKSIEKEKHINIIEEENKEPISQDIQEENIEYKFNDEIKNNVKDNTIYEEVNNVTASALEDDNSYRNQPVQRTTEVRDVNVNRIVIKKVEKQETPKRITYYLKPETIKKIDKFSKMAGMGKSEFVQTLLDEVLNNLEIEK